MNLGSGRGSSIRTLGETLAAIVRAEGRGQLDIEERHPPAEDPVPVLVLDPARLQALTDWVPPTRLEEGLRASLIELNGVNVQRTEAS